MNIALTFDLEKDANLSSTYGISIGLKKILKILKKYSVKSTFFVTSYIAQNYPKIIKRLSHSNEIGSHGHIHKKYKKIGDLEKKGLKKSKLLLEEITGKKVLGFRAPNLYTNLKLYKTLKELNFVYDASGKPNSNFDTIYGLKIFKVSNLNIYFRFPFGKTYFKTKCYQNKNDISIIYFHPWEAVDMKRLYIRNNSISDLILRPDRWLSTGESFLEKFEDLIKFFIARKFKFRLLKEML
ncbi:MAG: polysaccharide deacetylase family protein [Candidatus Helarchaeota archaeon]|nr:polysaccharide deacetylase family protein [Candidatus Helarchaeota archaeon]